MLKIVVNFINPYSTFHEFMPLLFEFVAQITQISHSLQVKLHCDVLIALLCDVRYIYMAYIHRCMVISYMDSRKSKDNYNMYTWFPNNMRDHVR